MRKENGTHHKVAEFKSESISQQNNEVPLTALSGLPKGNGEFCHIERIFRESGMFSFCGKEKVETADDVAYIFKELENASVENAFVVLVKESIPTIVHLGMGLFAETQVNLAAIKAAYDALGADQVYFVHNHPSGNLHCSRSDVRSLNVIADMVGNNVLREGIIINTTSGKYGTFNLKGNSEETNYPQLIRDEYPLKLYSFDKTVFSRDYDPQKLNVVHSSRDIAALISSQRLGNRQKVSYLILDHGDHIVGNLHTAFNAVSGNETKIANEIVQNTIRFGGVRVVLYGSYSLQNVDLDFLNREVGRFSGHTVKLLDCIVADGLHTQSAIDLSLMEPTVKYKRESLQNDTNIYEMDDIRFRIEDNYTQEELLIIDLARDNGTYLKAPNGEVSNLSPEQWAQVRTTAFKKWFGDWENNPDNASRIIDKNGEPMVVYHGSPNDFKIFDYGKIQTTRRAGFYFTRNIDLAKNYQKGGELIEAFVNLRKPLNSDETKKEITKELFVEIANEAGIERDMRRLYDIADSDIDLVSFLISTNNDIKSVNDALYTVTKHDGIIMKGGGLGKSYVAFSPNQIKSAIENVGTFSLDNDDIRFRIIDHLRYRFIGEKGARKMNDAAGEINRDPDELIATINEYATELHHTSIRIIHNVEELPEDSTPYKLIKAGRDIKAYFDPKSKEVAVYLPNIQNTEDAKRSVYHEVVAHYGLREMYGVHFDNFLDNVFDNAMPVIQGKILYATQGDPSKLREATEEYLAKLAEHGFDSPEERTFWKKIQSAFIDMLRQANVSLNFKLTDDSLRCILYKSYLKLTQEVSNNNLNLSKMEEKTKETTQATEKIIPDEIKGVVLTKQQKDQLSKGKQVLLDNLIDRNGKSFSANVSYDFENNKPIYSFPEKQNQEFRMPNVIKGVELSEENKQQLTQGEKVFLEGMRSAKGTLFDAYVYIDKEKKTLAFDFPEKKQDQDFRMPNAIKGVELSGENKQRLTQGEKVFLEGMTSAKGSLFDAYVYIDQEKKTLAFDFPEKKEKKKESVDSPQAEAIEKPKKKKLGL